MADMVVDPSLALKWLVEEDDTPKARALRDQWANDGARLVAPYLLPFELANVLHRRVLRDELREDQAQLLLEGLLATTVELLDPPSLHTAAMQLAYDAPVPTTYDAHYVALAEHLGCELWTADLRLHQAFGGSFASVRLLGEYEGA